jgi:hypothetical protein
MVSAIALTFAELTGCGKVAAASIASSMRPIVSGAKDAFEKSFIRSVLVPQEVMEPTRPIELVPSMYMAPIVWNQHCSILSANNRQTGFEPMLSRGLGLWGKTI